MGSYLVPIVTLLTSMSRGSLGYPDNTGPTSWPQFDMAEHVPGEPLSPIDYQNAELLLNIPPPNTVFNRDPIELAGLFEGDIILQDKDKGKGPELRDLSEDEEIEDEDLKNAIIKEQQKWPGGIIPYFISAQFDPMERSTIARAFLEYQRSTCIVFKPRTTEADYIHITKGNGCSSHVGRTGGAQPVILGNGCVYPGIAMHELMHAVGFWHEQSRWDRDDHVSVAYQNILPNMDFNFQKYTWNSIQNLGVGYDTSSILHYGPFAFSKDRRHPTIVPKVPNDNMGQRKTFSPNDIMKINRLYRCMGAGASASTEAQPPTPATATPPSTTGVSRCLDSNKYCPDWSARGECTNNPTWMLVNCKKSCDRCNAPCDDVNQYCPIWAQRGECGKNSDYMKTYCPKSCGTCARETGAASDDNECGDKHVHCDAWAARGECTINPNYMLSKCKKACKVCVVTNPLPVPPGVSVLNLEPQESKVRRGKTKMLNLKRKQVQKEL